MKSEQDAVIKENLKNKELLIEEMKKIQKKDRKIKLRKCPRQ